MVPFDTSNPTWFHVARLITRSFFDEITFSCSPKFLIDSAETIGNLFGVCYPENRSEPNQFPNKAVELAPSTS